MDNNTAGNATIGGTALAPNKVVPLLQQLSRLEELTSALHMRLDPIVQHEPATDKAETSGTTVTVRLSQLGDSLQYLLDHIEL